MKTLIFGHKNPDTDSVCSAIAYSFLKNSLNEETEPRVLGEIKNEARYVLDHFHLPYPEILDNVKTQVKDVPYYKSKSIDEHNSYLKAFKTMDENSLNTIAITDENNYLTYSISIFIRLNHCNILCLSSIYNFFWNNSFTAYYYHSDIIFE